MTRLLTPPRPVEVETGPGGEPAFVSRSPASVQARWLVELDWWRQPVAREYWRVLLDESLLCELFRDRLGGGWFLERVYD